MDDWKAHRLDEDLGTSFRATLGVKYSVNLTVLNFFNWTPVSGSWKIYEVGNHGTVLFGKPYGN